MNSRGKMGRQILVINPNSNEAVTAALDRSLERMRFAGGPEITCMTLAEGPLGIETSRQSAELVTPLCNLIARERDKFDAFVVGCFSDPGVIAAREMTNKPVLGLCEAGVSAALNFGERFGILTNMESDANGERRLLRAQGLDARLAGIEAIGVSVTDLQDVPEIRQALLQAARRLERSGAGTVVLGCAGMTPFAERLAEETGLWVVNPVVAAVGLAIAAVVARG
jgi:allantoin racemase